MQEIGFLIDDFGRFLTMQLHPRRIIHQSWKTSTLPAMFSEYAESWKRHNPTWEYKLWTDEDNRELVTTHYPEFLLVGLLKSLLVQTVSPRPIFFLEYVLWFGDSVCVLLTRFMPAITDTAD